MRRHFQFVFHLLWMLPLLPILYVQGKRIRANFPDLPEPKDTKGVYTSAENAGQPLKVLILGESTMAGVGARTHEQAFAGALARHLGESLQREVQWVVQAQSGITLKRLSAELVPHIQARSFQMIVIGMGANDAFHLNPPYRWRQHLKLLTSQLQTKYPDASIYYCSMPPIKDFTAFPSIMKRIIGGWSYLLGLELEDYVRTMENVYFDPRQIQLESWVSHLPKGGALEDLFSDGVHPSEAGYQIWAKETCRFIFSNWKSRNGVPK